MSSLSAPDGRKTLEKQDALNEDIISTIHRNFPRAVEQTKEFAEQFRRGTKTDTARAVWEFLKKAISYLKDPEHSQMVRMPSRFVFDGVGDCKSYSLMAASLLYNLGFRPVKFRYANYKGGEIPTHVYVVTADEDGRQIIVDGVWNKFNSEKQPTRKFDKNPMNVYTLSDDVSGIGKAKKKRKGFLKKLGKGLKKIKVAKGLKKISLAPSRRAFRTIVALNIRGLGTKMAKAIQKNPSAVQKKWEKLGGKFSELKKSIAKGAKRKRILGVGRIRFSDVATGGATAILRNRKKFLRLLLNAKKRRDKKEVARLMRLLRGRRAALKGLGATDEIALRGAMAIVGEDSVNGIGVEPTTTTAGVTLATAAPVLIAIISLLASLGIGKGKDDGSSLEDIKSDTQEAARAYGSSGGGGGGGGYEASDPTDPDNADKFETDDNVSDEPSGFKLSTPLKIGGAALAAWLLFGGKKRAA